MPLVEFSVVRAFTKVVPPEVKSILPVFEVIELPMLIPAVVSRSICTKDWQDYLNCSALHNRGDV